MTDSTPPERPDRRPSFRRPPADLEILAEHPSLAPLAAHGWQLDRLPVTSTAWAFAAAMLVSLLAFGLGGAVLVVLGIVLTLALSASAMVHRDVAAARVILRTARAALLAWLVVSGLLLRPSWADDGVATGTGPSSSSSAGATHAAPAAERAGGAGQAGSGYPINITP